MTRYVPLAVLLVMLAAGGVAHAQASLPGGVTLSFDKLYIHEGGSTDAVLPKTDPDSLWRYFNLAHCQCGKALRDGTVPTFVESTFEYLVLATPANAQVISNDSLNVWVGASCNNMDSRNPTNRICHPTGASVQISTIQASNNAHVVVPVYDAMNPEAQLQNSETPPDCMQRVLTATVWGLADSTPGNNMLDYPISKTISTDSQPPTPLPSSFHVSGGEGAIQISWTPASDTSDVFAYQALCLRADDDSYVKPTSHPDKRYMTATTLCGLAPDPKLLTAIDLPAQSDAPDAGAPVTLPPKFADLDVMTLCGEVQSATATSLRIDGLQNGVAYKVALLVEDKYQNVAGVYFTSTVTPVPSTDFWEDLHGRGSNVDGGLCLLAETYGDDSGLTGALRAFRDNTLGGSRAGRWLTEAYYASLGKLGALVHGSIVRRGVAGLVLAPLVALALLWHWLGLPVLAGLIAVTWWYLRRRRTAGRGGLRWLHVRAAGVATVGALMLLGASPARAGNGGYQPYWEDNDPTNSEPERVAPGDPSLVHWQVGIRVGPYVPDIDSQAKLNPGPYAQMFGGARAMPMLDVDRFLWTGFGQLGVGISAGYMQKFAHTFQIASDPMTTDRARSQADTNTFRLIPLALTATYRLTWFDDEYGVPVIPYVRGGFSYYVWWLSVSDGNFAKVCNDGGMEPACGQNKAFGASLGVQGSIGLAVRAERIDSSAAMSMQQSGIEHAGIFAELSAAKVDGFGSDKKLSVGDRTWFAGVNFEF